MVWHVIGAALACALGLGAASANAATITNPDWLRRPTAEDMARTFPELATNLRLDGRAVISCAVNTAGRARNCTVISEAPKGLGFGQAALELADVFRFSPKKRDGRPIPGGSVQVPIRFKMPEEEPIPSAPPLPPATAGAKALAVGLHPHMIKYLIDGYALGTAKTIEESGATLDPATAAAARRAFQTAATRLAPQWATDTAAVYAALMNETELAAEVAFVRSPAGGALLRYNQTLSKEEADSFTRWLRIMATQGRAAFCATQACVATDWKPTEGLALTDEAWAQQPHVEHLREQTPPIPLIFDIAGWAQLNCYVGEDGALDMCVTARESPENLGFAMAASSLQDRYVLDATKARMLADKMVAVQIRFPSRPEPKPPSPPGPYPVTPDSLGLARQVLMASDFEGGAAKGRADLEQSISLWSADSEAAGAAAIAAMRSAANAAEEATKAYYAERMASHFSIDELRALLAYHNGPAAKARRRNEDRFLQQLTAIHADHSRKVGLEARRLFCIERDCTIPRPPPAKP